MQKKFYRSSKDVVFGGVAGGLAEYFKLDPLLMRIAFLILIFISLGLTILIYIILWIFVPANPLYKRKKVKK